LDNISLSIEKGSFNLLCGESGCGKTTLLKLLKKEISPYGSKEGEILYNNFPLSRLNERASACEIGFVGQSPDQQIVTDKVWHELAFGLENIGESTQVIRRRVGEMASYFGIQNWYHRSTDSLSGGQKQLLNLASVMVMQPEILLLDEPTGQLYPIAAADFFATLQKLNRELGLTILIVEHRLEEVYPIADKIAAMQQGRIIAQGTPAEAAEQLRSGKLSHGLPSAVRIWAGLQSTAPPPLTVKEGREFLESNYAHCAGRCIKEKPYNGSEPVLQASNVYFRYQKDMPDILRDFSISVNKGEVFSILGGNGTGKTTTLNILAGLDKPYKGKSKIYGKKISQYKGGSLYRNMLSLLPQNPATVFLQPTVQQDFEDLLKATQCPKEEISIRVEATAAKFSVTHLLGKHHYDLSGGEQQKCALAKLMLTEPKIILLDEPTKGMDAFYKNSLAKVIRELQAEGRTIIMVTHDIEFAAMVSTRCALFFDGQLISQGTPNEFFAGNSFYTTSAGRISRGLFKNAVLCSQVIQLCTEESGAEK